MQIHAGCHMLSSMPVGKEELRHRRPTLSTGQTNKGLPQEGRGSIPNWMSLTWEVRVVHSSYSAALKLHLVFCQRACLVREDVLNLSQVFGDVEGPALHPFVWLLVIQLQILGDEVDLAQLHQLHRHIQWQRDHALQPSSPHVTFNH